MLCSVSGGAEDSPRKVFEVEQIVIGDENVTKEEREIVGDLSAAELGKPSFV